MKVLSLFSGIGAFEKALTNLKVNYEVVAYSEIDRYAAKAYSLIHNIDQNLNLGDIKKISLPPNFGIDLITYGFPCQDISLAGKGKGFIDENGKQTRSGLFFDALKIIKQVQPKIAIAENVEMLVSKRYTEEFKAVLSELDEAGYINKWMVLNARDYGVPQRRKRVFIVSIRKDIYTDFQFPEAQELKHSLKDLLEENVDSKFLIDIDTYPNLILERTNDFLKISSATIKGYDEARVGDYLNLAYPNSTTRRGKVGKGVSQTLTTSGTPHSVILKENDNWIVRRLTPKECFRLMGFEDKDIDILVQNNFSNTQLYKLAGNSIVVNVLEAIFQSLFSYGYLKEN